MIVQIQPPARIGGTVSAPPSKSMAHRAVLCSALAKGTSHLKISSSARISRPRWPLPGSSAPGWNPVPPTSLWRDWGISAPCSARWTAARAAAPLRFLIPLASLTGQSITFVGRGRLMERPQSVYETLYREQNLHFEQANGQLTVAGSLRSGEYAGGQCVQPVHQRAAVRPAPAGRGQHPAPHPAGGEPQLH